jgi:glycosyltransferase involved in cell wall biosynthesis
MMAGVPVISTRHGSIPDLIAHGENGLLVPVRDSRALAEAITQIALDHNQRKRMGEANFARGHEFRTDVVVPKMLGIMFRTQVE